MGDNNTQPTIAATTLDPDVQTFTKAIAMQEGGGSLLPYDSSGGSGETGRYQFEPATWEKYAGEVLGDPNAPMTSENQNQVAYTKLKDWHDQGYTWAQEASMWNAGEGAPDAYKENNVGTNSSGVLYNTPQYVDNVQRYAQLLSQGGESSPQSQNTNAGGIPVNPLIVPPTLDNTPSSSNSSSQGGIAEQIGGVAGNLLNFAFPFLGDITADAQGQGTKTALQQLGDLGLSSLWFVPGVGELGESAIDAARLGGILGETGTKIAGTAIGGAGIGYGADVASNLSQGQTGAGVFKPGLGMATGGVLGAAAPLVSKLLPKVLSLTSERPLRAFKAMSDNPTAVKAAIDKGVTSSGVLGDIQKGIKGLRNQMSAGWQTAVNNIADEFSGKVQGVSDSLGKKLQTISDEFGVDLPQNIKSMSAKEFLDTLTQINELPNKFLTTSPKGALLRSTRDELKSLAIKNFGGPQGSFATLLKSYSTKKGVFEAADTLFKPYKLNNPKIQKTAQGVVKSLFNKDNEGYLAALRNLEAATGQDFTSKAAALQFMQKAPSFKFGGKNTASAILEGVKGILGAPISSPRGAAFTARKAPGFIQGVGTRSGLISNLLSNSLGNGQ